MATSTTFPARRQTPGDSDENTDQGTSRSAPSKRIPSSEWEKRRPIITKLYQEEKKSLKEVMEILERDFGFTATVKMFKSRIWKWGLDKKLKCDEVLAVLILKSERDALGQPSEFTIRGQPVDLDNIDRYVRRNPGLVARFRAGEQPNIQTTLEVQCRTPSPTLNPSVLPLVEMSSAERVLGLFNNYIDNIFATKGWDYEYNDFCIGKRPLDRSDELFERVTASFALINRSMMRMDGISITTFLSPAFESLKEIIESGSPVFVIRTAWLLWYLDRYYKDLLKVVMNFLANLVPKILGQNHPMAQIWQLVGSPEFTDFHHLCTRLYSLLGPLLENRIGSANFLTTVLYGDYIDCLHSNGRSEESLGVATEFRNRADATGMQHPWLVELAMAQTAVLCKIKEAEGNIQESIACLEKLSSYDVSPEQQAIIDVQLGNYSYQAGDAVSAIERYRQATRSMITGQGDERLLITCLANLEYAFEKNGDMYKARQAHDYRLERLSDFAKESYSFAGMQVHPEKFASFGNGGQRQRRLDWL